MGFSKVLPLATDDSTVVELLSHHVKVGGSSSATAASIQRENYEKVKPAK